jgi:hypothetical protein
MAESRRAFRIEDMLQERRRDQVKNDTPLFMNYEYKKIAHDSGGYHESHPRPSLK